MLNKDFREFAALLNANGVEYLIVGGYALAIHGHPRYTGDIDFWINAEPGNVRKLLDCLAAFGFASLGLTEADFVGERNVIQLGIPPARIDLMTQIDGVSFAQCYARRTQARIDDMDLSVLHLQDFLTNKRAVGRLKDLADIEAIQAIARPDPSL